MPARHGGPPAAARGGAPRSIDRTDRLIVTRTRWPGPMALPSTTLTMQALATLCLLATPTLAGGVGGDGARVSTVAQCAAVRDRVDCSSGNEQLSEEDCVARKCCWQEQPDLGGAAPDECLTGMADTPAHGVIGTMVWSQHVQVRAVTFSFLCNYSRNTGL
eukprot:SAG31_NODE_6215_length_2117_cov_3.103791_1_plen_161_part_00